MRLALPAAVAASLLLAGCGPTWSTAETKPTTSAPGAASAPASPGVGGPAAPAPTVAPVAAAKAPADVLVTEGDITDRPYTVIGDITVTVNKTTIFHADPTRELVTEALKKEAASKGADAVVLARYGAPGISFFSWGSMEGKGRAVTFNK